MLGLVVAHLVLACLLPLVSARSRRAGFAVAAVLPTAALVWALANAPEALNGGLTTSLAWAPELGLALRSRDGIIEAGSSRSPVRRPNPHYAARCISVF